MRCLLPGLRSCKHAFPKKSPAGSSKRNPPNLWQRTPRFNLPTMATIQDTRAEGGEKITTPQSTWSCRRSDIGHTQGHTHGHTLHFCWSKEVLQREGHKSGYIDKVFLSQQQQYVSMVNANMKCLWELRTTVLHQWYPWPTQDSAAPAHALRRRAT